MAVNKMIFKTLAQIAVAISFAHSLPAHANPHAIPYLATSAPQCSTLDFRQKFALTMRNQHHMNWCFAFATADALQSIYQIPEPISAADIAINYSKSNWARFLHFTRSILSSKVRHEPDQTGLVTLAAKMIQPQGYCPESALPSEVWSKVYSDGHQESVELLPAILDLFKLQKKVINQEIKTSEALPYFYEFAQINKSTFFNLLKTNTQKTFLESLRLQACQGQRKSFGLSSSDRFHAKLHLRSRNTFKQMNASFEKGIPVTVDFFSRVLKNIDAPTHIFKAYHTVLLYGRAYDPEQKECRYLMKNSYGESCNDYDSRLKCEKGYLWIPEHALFKSMTTQVLFTQFPQKSL